jgi:hypothetical protein
VPRNQGPWVRLRTLSVLGVPNLLRRIAQLSGEAVSMSLRELTVNEPLFREPIQTVRWRTYKALSSCYALEFSYTSLRRTHSGRRSLVQI